MSSHFSFVRRRTNSRNKIPQKSQKPSANFFGVCFEFSARLADLRTCTVAVNGGTWWIEEIIALSLDKNAKNSYSTVLRNFVLVPQQVNKMANRSHSAPSPFTYLESPHCYTAVPKIRRICGTRAFELQVRLVVYVRELRSLVPLCGGLVFTC